MQFLWKWVDELVGKGLEITVLLKLLFYAAITLSSMAFPLAVLLASLMTFGNMGERYEIVALKSAGISIRKMMMPLAFLSLLIGAVAFEFSNDVIPRATVKLKQLLFDIQQQKPSLNIEEGVFYNGFDNYAIRVGKKMPDGETIKDVLIYDHSRHQGNTTVTFAKQGTMHVTKDKKWLLFTLENGSYWDETQRATPSSGKLSAPLMRATFDKQYKRFDMSAFMLNKDNADGQFEMHSTTMSIPQLNDKIDTLKKQIGELANGTANVFFGNLFYYNAFVRKDSLIFDTLTICEAVSLKEMPEERANRILRYAEMASQSFIYSVRFSYQDVDFRTHYLWGFQIELFRKFTLALACVLFFFIGAPLGSIIRKGGIGIPLIITVLFFTLYFALSIIGEKIAKSSFWPIWFGMGLSSFVLIPICIFLTYQATVDSAIFSPEIYSRWLRKLKKFKLFSKHKNEDSPTLS